jgi:hypothetical protein
VHARNLRNAWRDKGFLKYQLTCAPFCRPSQRLAPDLPPEYFKVCGHSHKPALGLCNTTGGFLKCLSELKLHRGATDQEYVYGSHAQERAGRVSQMLDTAQSVYDKVMRDGMSS